MIVISFLTMLVGAGGNAGAQAGATTFPLQAAPSQLLPLPPTTFPLVIRERAAAGA